MTDRRLRVLMIAPTPYFVDRGCHVRIYEEARSLTRLGHDVRIATYHIGRDMPGIPTFRIPSIPWYGKLSAGPSWHKPYLDILLYGKALAAARSFRPDLIHAHLHEGAFIGSWLKRRLGLPLLFDFQGSLSGEIADHGFVRNGSLIHRLFRRLEGAINHRADFIVTSSGLGAEGLVADWGIDPARVRPLMDGVDCGEFRPYPMEEARRALGLPMDGQVAVFLGVLNRYQGIDILLESARIVRERGVAVRFLVMGFPEEGYRRRATEMGLGETVTFTGRIDYAKAPLLLSAGDMALSPKVSPTEANGKLFNYLACGLPVVAFDTPVNREILGDAGVLVRYGDPAAFAAGIEGLMADGDGRRELGRISRRRAEREHSWEARGRELETVYRLLAGAAAEHSPGRPG